MKQQQQRWNTQQEQPRVIHYIFPYASCTQKQQVKHLLASAYNIHHSTAYSYLSTAYNSLLYYVNISFGLLLLLQEEAISISQTPPGIRVSLSDRVSIAEAIHYSQCPASKCRIAAEKEKQSRGWVETKSWWLKVRSRSRGQQVEASILMRLLKLLSAASLRTFVQLRSRAGASGPTGSIQPQPLLHAASWLHVEHNRLNVCYSSALEQNTAACQLDQEVSTHNSKQQEYYHEEKIRSSFALDLAVDVCG